MKESKSSASGRGALAELKEAIGNLFDQVTGLAPDLGFGKEFPRHEMQVEDDGYSVRVELPGLKRDEIEVAVAGRTLSVSGERPRFEPPAGARMLRSERSAGKFDLSVTVPAEVDPLSVVAQMRDGILQVKLPKHTGPRGRSIEVEEDPSGGAGQDRKQEPAGESPSTQPPPHTEHGPEGAPHHE